MGLLTNIDNGHRRPRTVAAIGRISFPSSVRGEVAVQRSGRALSAFYQKRLSAKSTSALDASRRPSTP